jgi:pipecolate-incorporating enzyme
MLKRRLESRRGVPRPTIPRRDPSEPVPMSFAQWRLWFMEQLRPGTNAWNTPIAARLRGRVEPELLRRALATVVERHATLRTVFEAPGGKPAPVLLPAPAIELPVIDAPGALDATDAATDQAIDRFVAAEVARTFDLESDLMVRARMLRLGPEDHVLVLAAHHIACDGWSKGLLVGELCASYDALRARREPALPDLPIDYSDFASWQRDWLSGENLERLTGYWRGRLEGHAPSLDLPTDRPRPRTQAFQGAVQWLQVPGELARGAIEAGRRERATPFMTLMAAFKAMLHAHSGQDDVLVGSPSAMRVHPELEHLVGLFANTLVYRTSLAGRPSYLELVRRVRDTALGVYAHQDLPFEKIVEAVKPRRDPSRSPLVQVNMRVEGREPELTLAGVAVEAIPLDPGIARFDLAIELGETDGGYEGYLEYDTALFNPDTAAAYAADFVAVLEALVDSPERPIEELEPIRRIRGRARD